MMRKLISLISASIIINCCHAQFPVEVDSVYTFIKYNSVHRNQVNWQIADSVFKNNIAAAKTIKDTMNCFVSILEMLDDVHTQMYLNNQFYGYYYQYDDATAKRLQPLIQKSSAQVNKIYTQLLQKKYAYINIPGIQIYDASQVNNFAQAINDSIAQYATKKCKGFIIDLRLNGGGNLYPMLAGISQFLGNTVVGYETDINDSIFHTWQVQDGNFYIADYKATDIKTTASKRMQHIPVVVLLGAVTRSSGSMTAIAFKGRANTYFIGEPTAKGYTTSNKYLQFAPNFVLNFAMNYVADKNLKVYKESVPPDLEITGGDNFDNLDKDQKIIEALNWLKGK